MPFINTLGYDVFNPAEVVPEFTSDVGTKKGEKADYAIMKDGKPLILFECKWSGADLAREHASQLFRYFSAVMGVRFGVLTNGVEYQFYSDLDAPNRMDEKPFFVFNILDFQERHVDELKKFTKSAFDLEKIRATASELKYTAAIRRIISQEFDSPSDEFVTFFAKQVYSGRMTLSARQQFSQITHQALRRFLNDSINERLKQALEDNRKADVAMPVQESEEIEEDGSDETIAGRERKRGIVTTEDEIEGFFVIKSILRGDIDIKRVHMRDTKSYCGVLLDDNNRKPICRLRFNQEQKYLGLIDEAKREAQNPIVDVDDIYKYAETIRATVKLYDEQFGIPASRQDSAPSAETSVGDAQSSYTGKRVNTVTFKGRRQAVNSWKNAMLALFEALRASDLERFEKVAVTMSGRKRPHITRDASKLRQAQPIAGTELYVEANLSSQMIATLCYGLIAKMGFSASDLAFEIS